MNHPQKPFLMPYPLYILGNDNLRVSKYHFGGVSCFWSVANSHSLHVLSYIFDSSQEIEIVWIDRNPNQIAHLRFQLDLIAQCNTRQLYVEKLLGIKCGDNSAKILEIIPEEWMEIRGRILPHSLCLYDSEIEFWSDVVLAGDIFQQQYKKAVTITGEGLTIAATSPLGVETTHLLQVISCMSKNEDVIPYTAAYGCGYLRSEEKYQEFQTKLRKSKITFVCDRIGDYIDNHHSQKEGFTVVHLSNACATNYPTDDPALLSIFRSSEMLESRFNMYRGNIWFIECASLTLPFGPVTT